MTKQVSIQQKGVVEESLPNAQFRVRTSEGLLVLAVLSGKMRKNFIKILLGDEVDIEVSPYDLFRGRIIYRYRKGEKDVT